MLPSASDKAKLFAKNFSKNLILIWLWYLLTCFLFRTNLKLHNISITPKMVKKVITNPDSSMASGPDCIPVVVLKNCEPELSYILQLKSSICVWKSIFFPDWWKVSLLVPYGHVWNTVVMSRLVLLVVTWNCWISYKNGYAGLLVLNLLPLLNSWLIVEILPA